MNEEIKNFIEQQIRDHTHDGALSRQINYFDLFGGQPIYIHHTIYGTGAATATNYGVFWIAPFDCTVTEIREVHQTAGSSADAALQIEKLTGTQALDSGVTLNTAIELDGTANTVVTATRTSTAVDLQLSRGDRLALKDAGTLTAVANVTVVIEVQIVTPFINKN